MRRPILEALILDGLKDRLMAPELVKEFVAEFHREVNRLSLRRSSHLARCGEPGPCHAAV
jgi:hypothetical protein